jgi:hypothetical protein
MRRKDKPPKGVGKPDLLSVLGLEAMDTLTRKVLTVSKDEIERREREELEPKATT